MTIDFTGTNIPYTVDIWWDRDSKLRSSESEIETLPPDPSKASVV
ncbi:hypothetical protein AVEN_154371-1, partial [Araneus ventricosus]